jgi:hypothetical protein
VNRDDYMTLTHRNKDSEILLSSLLVTALMLLGMLAILPLNTVHAQSTIYLTVNSATNVNGGLSGYYTILYQNGNVLESGYTTINFTLTEGQTYSIQADSYGNCQFAYWRVPNSPANTNDVTQNPYTFTAVGNIAADQMAMTSFYSCSSNGTTSQLTISSVNQNNNPIYGYYTVLNQSNTIVATAFTTATFTVNDDQQYTVQVDNYGSCTFSHWMNVYNATQPIVGVRTTADTGFTAVYNCGGGTSGGGGSSGTFTINVNSVDQKGNAITGYDIELYSASGPYFVPSSEVASGFTPASFIGRQGQEYVLHADSYGSCTFSYWSVNPPGSGGDIGVAYTGSPTETWTAIYNCGSSSGGNVGTSQLTIESQDTSGNTLTGFYTVLNQSGAIVATGFTPHTFTVNNAQTYTVQVDNYGSCSFAYWQDNHGTTHYRTVYISSNTQYTAVYSCSSG